MPMFCFINLKTKCLGQDQGGPRSKSQKWKQNGIYSSAIPIEPKRIIWVILSLTLANKCGLNGWKPKLDQQTNQRTNSQHRANGVPIGSIINQSKEKAKKSFFLAKTEIIMPNDLKFLS